MTLASRQRIQSRIIWLLVYGCIPPKSQIDHIDHNPLNNSLQNLRLVSLAENSRNRKIPPHNTSGYIGVSWSKKIKKWRAYITVDKKFVQVGTFKTKKEAALARAAASRKYGFHPNHGLNLPLVED